MSRKNFFKSKEFKIILPMVMVFSVIAIVRTGYEAGVWLYEALH
jgi:hypothetical protein